MIIMYAAAKEWKRETIALAANVIDDSGATLDSFLARTKCWSKRSGGLEGMQSDEVVVFDSRDELGVAFREFYEKFKNVEIVTDEVRTICRIVGQGVHVHNVDTLTLALTGKSQAPFYLGGYLGEWDIQSAWVRGIGLIKSIMAEVQKPFPPKLVCWETIRNIANELTNQLVYLCGDEVDVNLAHVSSFSHGPRREFTLEPGETGRWLNAGQNNGWHAFDESDVSRLYWQAAQSENSLEAVKLEQGRWELKYIPSEKDPLYRGNYYAVYEDPEGVSNITLTPSGSSANQPTG